MEIQFDITRGFQSDLRKLSSEDRRRVDMSIEKHATTFDPDSRKRSDHIYQPQKALLPRGLESSLYVLRASPRIRVILAIESDPLFERKLVTLLRAVKHDDLDRAYRSVSEALYQDLNAYTADERIGGNGRG